MGYRFTRDVLHQVDASSQWRWSEKWQTVARLNYSIQDQRILEGLAGLEYNACCWSLRFVLQHLTTATQKTTTAAFLQLELNGLMQIGSNPLHVLQRSIPGYIRTGSQGSSPFEGPITKFSYAFIPLILCSALIHMGKKFGCVLFSWSC